MTKEEFKKRWDSNDDGGGIRNNDIAKCAVSWGLYNRPKIHSLRKVTEAVLKAAKCN